jgi:putative DNA primase/helicase
MGGVLEVAGIESFLGNLDEMMQAADSEGAAWNTFIAGWWDRFGTAAVGTNDLFEVAALCEPPLPLGSGNDQSRRTRLGKAVPRMRDRVFHVSGEKVRLSTSGTYQGARRWKLQIVEGGHASATAPNPPANPTLVGDHIRDPPSVSDQPAWLSEVS